MAADSDRISELPEEILLHILSFVPTEDVVVASLVSKRWRPLWFSVPTLDFDQERFEERRPEKQQQERPLKRPRRGKQQQRFGFANFVRAAILARGLHPPIKRFRLYCDEKTFHAKQWFNDVIQRGVENIEIKSFTFEFPGNIFNCTTLVVLKLYLPCFRANVYSFDLPSLKTLHLTNTLFLKPQTFMDFLYGCPVLENLQLYHVSFLSGSFEGKIQTLSKLVRADIRELRGFHIPVKVLSNVKFLHLDDECDQDIPMFPNLIHLELLGLQLKWNSLTTIFNCSPNLQRFVLHSRYPFHEDWPIPQFVPQCISSQLRYCVIANYAGWPNQMTFAKYVMRNSTSLHTMTIICNKYYRDCNDYCKEELACPRTCELLFE